MENVIVVRRTVIVFSMKLTPVQVWLSDERWRGIGERTQRLDIVFIETALDILDHEARLAYLRIPDHSDFDNHAVLLLVVFEHGVRILATGAGQCGRGS